LYSLRYVHLSRGLLQTFASYRFYLDEDPTKTEMVAGSNPEYKHEKMFHFKVVTESVSA